MDEIRALERAIIARCGPPGARPQALPPELETRRRALLGALLGFEPAEPLACLHVAGDSHAAFFAGTDGIRFHKGRRVFTGFFRARYVSAFTELLPVFRVFHLGPATAWQAAERGSSTRSREKVEALLRHGDIPPGTTVLLVFGEIDCRFHIPRSVLGGKPLDEAVAETAERLLRLARRLREAGRRPAVWLPTVVPKLAPSEPPHATPLPALGSQALREEITARYCEELARLASENGFPAAGIALPPDGTPPREWFWDGNHLSPQAMPPALAALRKAGILALAPAQTGA